MSASSLRSVRCVRHPMPGRRASSVPAARGAEADPAASVRAGGAAYRRQGAAGSLHPGRSRAAPGRSIRGLMWLDAAVLALIAWLGWAGARAGAEVAGVRLLGLPLAYAGALGAGYAFGPALARELGLSRLAASLAASSVGFAAVLLALHLVLRAVRERCDAPSARGQALGALFGALRGALLALPLLWLGGLAEGARS